MFHEILVPVDLSEKNREAIERALALGAPGGGRVVLLHVIETLQDVAFEEAEDFYRSLEKRARERLDAWQAEFGDRGCAVESEIVFGHRAREIVNRARQRSAELVVLGTHRVDPYRPGGGLGTISHLVALLAPCDVLLVR